MRAGQRLEYVPRIERRIAHRQPARTAIAKRAAGNGPVIDPRLVLIGVDRHVPSHDGHFGAIHIRAKFLGPGIHGDGPAAARALPFKMHPVEIQGDTAHRRAIPQMVGLARIDRFHKWQHAVPDQEPASDALNPLGLQGRCQFTKPIGAQRRITTAHEHQIALQNTVLDRTRRDKPGAKPIACTERIHRIERCDHLCHAGRWQRRIRVHTLQQLAAICIRNRTDHLPDRPSILQDRLQPLATGAERIEPTHLRTRRRTGCIGKRRAGTEGSKSGDDKATA